MKDILKTLFTLLIVATIITASRAQAFEHTYVYGSFDHSNWKVQPNSPQGYVMMGTKFFEPGNTSIYVQGFDEFGQPWFQRVHTPTGFSSLQTFWKSFTVSPSPIKYFAVAAGTLGGANKAYALLVNAYGMKYWDRVSDLPSGIQFGGVCNATNGGWVATGSDGSGQLFAAKFDSYGQLEWINTLPVSGFGWCIIPANGGGYLIGSTTHRVTRIDHLGDFEWSTAVSLPLSPDGSAYTYSEFEELIDLPFGQGVILTGSTFSNQTSAAYTARLSYSGSVAWRTVHNPQNTSMAGTPVSWINSAIIDGSNVVTSWRTGPVSTGGDLRIQKQDFNGTLIGGVSSLGNTIPVQEAFLIKPHGKYVVGGTRGSYTAAYSYVSASLPTFAGESDDRTEPLAEPNPLYRRQQISIFNSQPEFVLPPTSRVFLSELRVFPNPSSGLVNIGGKVEPGALLRVSDTNGSIVLERQIGEGEDMLQLDLTGQAKGLYYVQMIGAKQSVTKKIVIQ